MTISHKFEARKLKYETKMLNPKLETPAFAGATSRRQAKFSTNSNAQSTKLKTV
jgi:hypothetical protein